MMVLGGEDKLEAGEASHSGRWPKSKAANYDDLVLVF